MLKYSTNFVFLALCIFSLFWSIFHAIAVLVATPLKSLINSWNTLVKAPEDIIILEYGIILITVNNFASITEIGKTLQGFGTAYSAASGLNNNGTAQ